MGRFRGLMSGALALAALSAGVAEARPRRDVIYDMVIGQPAPPPAGYNAFCLREPADCAVPDASAAGPPLKPNYWAFAFHSAAVQKRFAYRARTPLAEPPASIRRPALFRLRKASAEPLPAPASAPPRLEEAGRIIVTRQVRSTLNRINRGVNRRVISVGDRENYGVADFWALPLSGDGGRRGDCEDYVVEKRHQLLAAGYPMQALSIALVRTRWNDTHAVLLVETDEGALALDSFTGWIGPWWKLDYQWIMRQSPKDPSIWVSVLGDGWSGQEAPEPG
jgi:predicted transglutaminase-like cysteine proteinase